MICQLFLQQCNMLKGQALVDTANRVRLTDRISEEWRGQQLQVKLLATFVEIVSHSIEHRANTNTMHNQEGQAPSDLDGWAYLLARLDRLQQNGDD